MIGNMLWRIEILAMSRAHLVCDRRARPHRNWLRCGFPENAGSTSMRTGASIKEKRKGAEKPDFNDSDWKLLRLPHDWAIEGPFDEKLNPETGGLPVSGTGWYRKSFLLPPSAQGRIFTVVFDGAMANSTVWINGEELGGRPYGYSSFFFNLTPHLHFGSDAECSCCSPDA